MKFADRLHAAKAALQKGSTVQIIALHNDGFISAGEVLEATWQICHENPSLRAVLMDQFLKHHDAHIANFVGKNLEELSAENKTTEVPISSVTLGRERMNRFKYPTAEGAKEVALALGISADAILGLGQDWEYTFPTHSDLPRYEEIYAAKGTSDSAKRVLGCFIFQCLEDHMQGGGSESIVISSLARLARDFHIHQQEFRYWSLADNGHYDKLPEDGWSIMNMVREHLKKAEQGADGNKG